MVDSTNIELHIDSLGLEKGFQNVIRQLTGRRTEEIRKVLKQPFEVITGEITKEIKDTMLRVVPNLDLLG